MLTELIDQFCEAAGLNNDEAPYSGSRVNGKVYANCIVDGAKGHEWFADFQGVEFFGELRFAKKPDGRTVLIEVVPVRMTGRTAIRGRGISAQSILLT